MFTGLLAAGIAGGASLAGSLISSNAAADAQDSANWSNMLLQFWNNKFQAEEAQKQRDWQTAMANSAYQRAVADLRKAGLNPLLVSPNGAATPSGAMPSTRAAQVAPSNAMQGWSGLGDSVNSALSAIKTFNDSEMTAVRKGMIEANTELAKLAQEYNVNENMLQDIDMAARYKAMTGIDFKDTYDYLNNAGVSHKAFDNLVKMYSEQIRVGKYMPALNAVGAVTGAVSDLGSAYKSVVKPVKK